MLSDFVDIGSNLVNSIYGIYNNERKFAYQEQLNNLQMSREDSAYQRAVADATEAGLSKAVVGGGSNSSALSTFSGQSPEIKSNALQRAMNRASMAQMQNQNELLQAQTAKALAEAEKAKSDVNIGNEQLRLQSEKQAEEILKLRSDLSLSGENLKLLQDQVNRAQKDTELYYSPEWRKLEYLVETQKLLSDYSDYNANISAKEFEKAMTDFRKGNIDVQKFNAILHDFVYPMVSAFSPVAVAGMNNATSVQTTAMNNANARAIQSQKDIAAMQRQQAQQSGRKFGKGWKH